MQDGQMELTVLFGVTIAFLITSCLAIALRVYVRAGLLHRFGWDDFSALLSLVSFFSKACTRLTSQGLFHCIGSFFIHLYPNLGQRAE